jgi:hypothetical protein
MKITLNLSPAPSARDQYALTWAIPATVIGLAAAVLLYQATGREYRDYRGMQTQLASVQSRADELRQQETSMRAKLDDPADKDLLRESQFVNSLITQRQLSLTGLNARIAGLLPPDAHLNGLQLTSPKKPGDDYLVRLGVTSKGEDAVETFINDLEDSPDFKDVSIINQGFQEQSSQGQEVSLICTARYLPGVDVDIDAEKPNAKESAPNRKPNH